jgi:hypothetical protein
MDDGRADAILSDERIESAPAPLRALFQEYEFALVVQALDMVGLNAPPENFTEKQIVEGAADAERILKAELKRRQKEMLRGGQG